MADSDSKCNDGIVNSGSGPQKFKLAYGKDSSDFCGSAADERGKKLGGGTSDLSHSLSGATASGSKGQ